MFLVYGHYAQCLELGVDGRIKLEWIPNKSNRRVWTGLMCLRIGTSYGLL
jgi:hypothetical protein